MSVEGGTSGHHLTSPSNLTYSEPFENEAESWTDSQSSGAESSVSRIEEKHSVPVTKAVNFREYIHQKFERSNESDVELCVGDHVLKCQRSILELYSGYIRKLRPPRKHIELPSDSVTPLAITCVYNWMRTPHYKIERDSALEVHAAAEFLKIESLSEQTWLCITSPLIVEDRAFMMYLEAIFFELPAVQSAMITRVQKFFLTLVGFTQFVELPFGHVCEMLASDSLGVNSELEVFFACVRYLNSHWEDRKERVFEMLRNVRFGLLPPHILVSFRFKKESPEVNRMLENVRVEKLLSQTMHFSIGLGTPPTGSLLFKEREWIYDFDCDYHSTKSLPGRKRLSYDKFLDYVRFLAKSETHWMSAESAENVEKAAQLMK